MLIFRLNKFGWEHEHVKMRRGTFFDHDDLPLLAIFKQAFTKPPEFMSAEAELIVGNIYCGTGSVS